MLLSSLAVVGCTSGSGSSDTVLPMPPASVKTSRLDVRPSAPIQPPAATMASAPTPVSVLSSDQTLRPQQPLAWEGAPEEPAAFGSMEMTVGMPVPIERPIAAIAPSMPEINSQLRSTNPRTQIYGHRFRDAKPINFGRTSPRKLAVHGVDVSRWQGDIDWVKLRTQGANFAYIKATDGGDHLDPMFKTNWRGAKAAGVKHGAYHFFYWCRTAGEQADWFIRNVPRDPDALPPVIDVEYNGESSCKMRLSRAKILEKMQVFMDKLERHYGKRPIIYTAPDFYADNLDGEFLKYPFWLRAVAQHPTKVYPGRKWVFWQYSGSGLTQGVSGKIDLNVFHGDEGDWHDWVADSR
jgi:lysozyme